LVLVLACLLMPRLGPQSGEGFGFNIDLAVAASLALVAFAAFFIGMHHVRDQLKPYDNWVEEATERGETIPDQISEKISRLEEDARTMLLGQGIMAGFVLLAPLGWFVSRDAKVRAWWFDAVLPMGLGLLAAGLLLAFYNRDWEFETVREWLRTLSSNRLEFN